MPPRGLAVAGGRRRKIAPLLPLAMPERDGVESEPNDSSADEPFAVGAAAATHCGGGRLGAASTSSSSFLSPSFLSPFGVRRCSKGDRDLAGDANRSTFSSTRLIGLLAVPATTVLFFPFPPGVFNGV